MAMICPCGRMTVVKTAWTEHNAGRRFQGCVFGREGCGFFVWIDPPLGQRATEVINGLLRRINTLEDRIAAVDVVTNNGRLLSNTKSCRNWFLITVLVIVLFVFVGRDV